MRYLCRRCLNHLTFFNNFQEFRFHMEYDHGLWFLAQTNDKKSPQRSSNIEVNSPRVADAENDEDANRRGAWNENVSISQDNESSMFSDSKQDSNQKDGGPRIIDGDNEMNLNNSLPVSRREWKVDPFLETSWPTDLIIQLHNKEKQLDDLQMELELSKNVVKQMEEKVHALQTSCQVNKDTIEYLNWSLLEKEHLIDENRKEITRLKRICEQNQKDADHLLNTLKAKINKLIEKSVVVETTVHEAHTIREKPSSSQQSSVKLRASRLQASSNVKEESALSKDTVSVFSHSKRRKSSDCKPEMFTWYEEQLKSCLMIVFQYLDPVSLIACTQVSRLWNECSSSPVLWKHVSFSHQKYSSKDFEMAASFCGQTETMVFEKISPPPKNELETDAEYQKRTRGAIEPGLEALLQTASNSVKQIFIIDCDNLFTKRSVWLVSCYCHNIEKLVYLSNVDPLNAEVIWSLGFGCRKLSALIIPPLHPSDSPENFTNQALNVIGEAFQSLRILCIGGNRIDIRGLTCIAKHCQQLQQLELDHVGEIRERAAITTCHYGFKGLLVLAFTFTVITPKAILHFYRSCPNLETITVHLEFTTYFPNPAANTSKNKEKYQNLIQHIQVLKHHSRLGEILRVFSEDIS